MFKMSKLALLNIAAHPKRS